MSDNYTKEELLNEIEKLISYGHKPTINPDLLKYLSIEDLSSIKNSLQNRLNTLQDDDKEWLIQFIKK